MLISEALLDAQFWIALSSRLGWEGKCWKCECGYWAEYFSKHDHQFCSRDGKKLQLIDDQRGEWKQNWHIFIDHLADGESAESFFATLS